MKNRLIKIDKVKEAAYYAISLHGLQTYDGHPYFYHLEQVVEVLRQFCFTGDLYQICGYLHDTLEDCAISYNDIKEKFGETVADIVYCVTDELGKNRKERKRKTYPKIASNEDAVIIKLADRIANLSNSQDTGHSMGKRYEKEYPDFRKALYSANSKAEKMWKYLDDLHGYIA